MILLEKDTLWEKLCKTKKPILLYGMGNGADKIIDALSKYNLSISGVFCSDDLHRNKSFHGFKLLKYSDAKNIFGDMVVLMSFGTNRDEVISLVENIAKEQELYVPDVPVYESALFDRTFFEAHKEDLEWVYSRLADQKSKNVFNAITNFKLSGKAHYLYSCETDNNEAFNNILKIDGNEHFLDLGAYNGDTVNEFVNYTGNSFKAITAVEPDIRNFKKLSVNSSGINNITLVNAAISDKVGACVFDSKGGRNSKLSPNGNNEIEQISVDSLNMPFTYIKMDVEGNELKTIYGAKQTLIKYKPKLLVSAYHKSEDLFSLPKAVLNINPSYKIYMRHYRYLPAWDTNFYFI